MQNFDKNNCGIIRVLFTKRRRNTTFALLSCFFEEADGIFDIAIFSLIATW